MKDKDIRHLGCPLCPGAKKPTDMIIDEHQGIMIGKKGEINDIDISREMLYIRRYTNPNTKQAFFWFLWKEGQFGFDFEEEIKDITKDDNGNIVLHVKRKKEKK